MKNIYLYRKINSFDLHPNPYIFDLEKALRTNFNIVNNKNNNIGILDPFKYLFKADIFYFNWIEILPQNRFGKIQTVIFYFFLHLAKIFNKKVVWTLHNKYSHAADKNGWTDFMYRLLIKYSDLIFTHSQVGVDFVRTNYPKYVGKVEYIVHPIGKILPIALDVKKEYDFLIWGGIQPYKGIVDFLKFLKAAGKLQDYRILIVGKCSNKEYKVELNNYLSANIIHLDNFYKLEEISIFANKSKFILFTYKLTSILSSGSLMDSIRMRANIFGPNDGAFQDLNYCKFVNTYNSFHELINNFESLRELESNNNAELEDFYINNNWEKAGYKLHQKLLGII